MGESVGVWGGRAAGIWELSVLSTQFSVNLKKSIKKNLVKKKNTL